MSVEMQKVSKDTEDDFFYDVYSSSRMNEVLLWGWGEIETKQFMKMQYECQKRSYLADYPDLESRIIYLEGDKVGRVLLGALDDGVAIIDITLLPSYQGKGIGTRILTEILNEAQDVQLSVRHNNVKAIRLYQRLGFYEISRNELAIKMEYKKLDS